MLRSSSSSRVLEEFFINSPPSQSHSHSSTPTSTDTGQQLPTYNPLSHAAKKERSRLRFAENAIHAIPFILALCAIILWFFSNPGTELLGESRV